MTQDEGPSLVCRSCDVVRHIIEILSRRILTLNPSPSPDLVADSLKPSVSRRTWPLRSFSSYLRFAAAIIIFFISLNLVQRGPEFREKGWLCSNIVRYGCWHIIWKLRAKSRIVANLASKQFLIRIWFKERRFEFNTKMNAKLIAKLIAKKKGRAL